jgi:hypothetical protein
MTNDDYADEQMKLEFKPDFDNARAQGTRYWPG